MGIGSRQVYDSGDFSADDDGMGFIQAFRRRKKNKKTRRAKPVKRRSSVRKIRSMVRNSRSKRKGMSKEFLRQLRKKHHLGEFKLR